MLTKLTDEIIITIIVVVGFLVYFNGLFNGFVLDDYLQAVVNPNTQSLKYITNLFSTGTFFAPTENHTIGIYYKPLLSTFYLLNNTLIGAPNAFLLHLTQLSLHIINSILLFYLFKKFFKLTIAFILSLFFLVHPINSESVLYISGAQEVLFMFFGLISLLIVIYKNNEHYKYILASVFFLLSLLSKESGILFLPIIVYYIFIFENKNRFKNIIPFFISLFIYLSLRINAIGLTISKETLTPIASLDLPIRLLHIPSLFFYYIERVIFPMNLVVVYNVVYEKFGFENFYFPLIIISLTGCFLFFISLYLYKNNYEQFKIYVFFLSFFVIGLLFHFHIVPLDYTASERWFYFPFIGFLGILAIIFINIKKYFAKYKQLFIMFIIGILLIFSSRTFIRTFDYKNNIVLALHDVKIANSDYLHTVLGNEYMNLRDFENSKKEFKIAYSLNPQQYFANFMYCGIEINLGVKNNNISQVEEGLACARKMLDQFGNIDGIHELLIYGYINLNNYEEAIRMTEHGLSIRPNDPGLLEYNSILNKLINNGTLNE